MAHRYDSRVAENACAAKLAEAEGHMSGTAWDSFDWRYETSTLAWKLLRCWASCLTILWSAAVWRGQGSAAKAWDGNSYLVAADGITLIDGEGVHRSPFDLEPLPPSIVEMELKYGVLPAWVSDKLAAQS